MNSFLVCLFSLLSLSLTCTHTHAHMRAHTHTHTHAYTHTHVHTYTLIYSSIIHMSTHVQSTSPTTRASRMFPVRRSTVVVHGGEELVIRKLVLAGILSAEKSYLDCLSVMKEVSTILCIYINRVAGSNVWVARCV